MAEQIVIFANPIAGRGQGRLVASRLCQRLRHAQYDVALLLSPADLPDATCQIQQAQAVIVIGGDGTVRTVARHLFRHAQPGRPHPPILLVPLGTANLLAQHLDIHWGTAGPEDQITAALANHQLVDMDVARANDEVFLLMAGIGIDGHIVQHLAHQRRGPITKASYALPALTALFTYRYPPLTVAVDGQPLADATPAMAFVGNVREYGTGFSILCHARPDDRLLDVCLLPCRSPRELATIFLQTAVGEHLHAEGVVYTRGRYIRIESPQPVPVQMDGEPAGHTPLTIDLLPERLSFIVPDRRG